MRTNIKQNTLKILTASALTCLVGAGCSTMQDKKERVMLDYQAGHYASATTELTKLAKSGDPESEYSLGYMYYYGIGVAKDESKGRYWIEKAARHELPHAKHALALIDGSIQTKSKKRT